MSHFQEELRRLRRELGIRQEDLARILHVDQSTVSQWESGKRKPPKDLQRLVLFALEAVK